MANDYYNFTARFQAGTLVRAEAVNAQLDAIAAAFDAIDLAAGTTIKMPVSFTGSNVIPEQTLANKIVYIDANGDVTLYPLSSLSNPQAEAEASAAAALASQIAAAASASASAASAGASNSSASNSGASAAAAAVSAAAAEASRLALVAAGASLAIDMTLRTGTFTVTKGYRYVVSSAGGSFPITLPLNPSPGDRFGISDPLGNFLTFPVTLARNGENIVGVAQDLIMDKPRFVGEMVFFNETLGWIFI